jgi:predicted nucleic acid-binding protein
MQPLLPDVDIWQRAFSRQDPDPLIVHQFAQHARQRQVFLVGWVRQALLARVKDQRQFTRLAWVLSSWPDLPIQPHDHERAATLMRDMRDRGTSLAPWPALLWALAERLDGTIWTRSRHWQILAGQGCPVRG